MKRLSIKERRELIDRLWDLVVVDHDLSSCDQTTCDLCFAICEVFDRIAIATRASWGELHSYDEDKVIEFERGWKKLKRDKTFHRSLMLDYRKFNKLAKANSLECNNCGAWIYNHESCDRYCTNCNHTVPRSTLDQLVRVTIPKVLRKKL